MSATSLSALALALLLATSTACSAAPEADEEDARSDAISSDQASTEWRGASKALSGRAASSADAKALGIVTWDVYLLGSDQFRGMAVFGIGRDGHVRYGIVSGSGADGAGAFALVNYDAKGRTVATDRDVQVLQMLTPEASEVIAAARVAVLAKAVAASEDLAAGWQRREQRFLCDADVLSVTLGLLGAGVGVGLAVTSVPLATLGVALGLLSGTVSLGGAAVLGFKVVDVARSAFDKTRCFASGK